MIPVIIFIYVASIIISVRICRLKRAEFKKMLARCTGVSTVSVIGFVDNYCFVEGKVNGETIMAHVPHKRSLGLGSKVDVLYNPKNTKEFYIKGYNNEYDILFFLKGVLFLGILVAILSSILFLSGDLII